MSSIQRFSQQACRENGPQRIQCKLIGNHQLGGFFHAKHSGIKSFDDSKYNRNQNNHQQENFQKQQYSLDAYKILEINENSNIEEIKAAYKKKIKEYHPDRLSGLGAELQQIAHQKTQEINSAYNFLKKIKGFS